MVEIEFTQKNIEDLRVKLGSLDLSPAERDLVSGFLKIATEAIARVKMEPEPLESRASDERSVVAHSDELPSIREQLTSAFSPGEVPRSGPVMFLRMSIGGGP